MSKHIAIVDERFMNLSLFHLSGEVDDYHAAIPGFSCGPGEKAAVASDRNGKRGGM
ncbi:MAG: hypothetical protein ABI659_02865 [Nitrosospira sp.]